MSGLDLEQISGRSSHNLNRTNGTDERQVHRHVFRNANPHWKWDFGDGQTSGEQSPVHAYLNEATYTVTLTVQNNFGSDTKVMKNLITVGKGPAVDFIADQTTVGVGRIVTFTDLSLNEPTNWYWNLAMDPWELD